MLTNQVGPANGMPDLALRYSVIRTQQAFLALRPQWEALYRDNGEDNFYLSFDWFTVLLLHGKPEAADLYVITACTGNDTIAIFPGCIEHRRLALFRHKILGLMGNIYAPYRGCLVKKGAEHAVARGLADFLMTEASRDWQAIDWEGLSPHDPFGVSLQEALRQHGIRLHAEAQYENILINLAVFPTMEAYFKSFKSSFREPIKRHINMMNREGGFDILLPLNSLQDVERCMDDYYAIYASSWKKKESEPDFHRHLARHLHAKGKLRLFVLYYLGPGNDRNSPAKHQRLSDYTCRIMPDCHLPDQAVAIAANLFVVEGQRAFFLKTSYREEYRRYAPGIVSMWFAFKYLFENDGVRLIDLQRGNEGYKTSFGGCCHEIRFRLLASNPDNRLTSFDLKGRQYLLPQLRKLKHRVITKERRPA